MNAMFEITLDKILLIGLATLGIYIGVIVLTRIFGKRSFSKMSSFDFAMTVAVGSIIASTILIDSVQLIKGFVGLSFVYIFQLSAAVLRRFDWFQKIIDNTPLLLMDGDVILEKNMKRARVTEEDLKSKLREANVLHLSHIRAVVFETTGDISVLHTPSKDTKLEPFLIEDVMR